MLRKKKIINHCLFGWTLSFIGMQVLMHIMQLCIRTDKAIWSNNSSNYSFDIEL